MPRIQIILMKKLMGIMNGNTPYVVMENMPVIEGVIILCEGRDNKELVSEITNAVYGLLNVPVHKIKVMKMS